MAISKKSVSLMKIQTIFELYNKGVLDDAATKQEVERSKADGSIFPISISLFDGNEKLIDFANTYGLVKSEPKNRVTYLDLISTQYPDTKDAVEKIKELSKREMVVSTSKGVRKIKLVPFFKVIEENTPAEEKEEEIKE